MIEVFIPTDSGFYSYENELKHLYENLQEKICDKQPFEFIKNNTLFYMFVVDSELLGGIYYFKENNKLFLNAFAKRKFLKEKFECLKLTLGWFKCDIYAEAQNRASALCLLKVGFQRYQNNLFIYTKKGI